MKKVFAFLSVFVLMMACVLPAYAADGTITYSGNASQFIFQPGSDKNPTNLFPNFMGIMPGDTLTQKITVKNNANDQVKVKIYIRSLGAQDGSEELLSQLHLSVKKSADNEMGYMFDAAADQPGGLSEWVCLGTLYSGGEVNLDITLTAPVELDNKFQNRTGYLDWQFMVEEFPVDPEDPDRPNCNMPLCLVLLCVFGATILVLAIFWFKKKDKD